MTCFAFLPQRFVNDDETLIPHLHCEMAFFAGYFLVGAVELERAVAIVREEQRIPCRGAMAFFATHVFFFSKLAAMRVRMAIRASKGQRFITHKTG